MDLQALKRRASVTHNKSLPEQARDAELLDVIAALERAVAVLCEIQWNGEREDTVYGVDVSTCPSCKAQPGSQGRNGGHWDKCELMALVRAFPPPGGEGATPPGWDKPPEGWGRETNSA